MLLNLQAQEHFLHSTIVKYIINVSYYDSWLNSLLSLANASASEISFEGNKIVRFQT
jgi:hypothetical protein